MGTLAAIFVRVIVPIMVTIAVGYIAARILKFDLKMLARLGLYVLVPCLTFTSMARMSMSAGEFGQILAFTLLTVPLLYGISILAARTLRLTPGQAGAFHISIIFANAVNFGFPVLMLAFGQAAIERGIVYAMTQQVVMQSFGVYLAARGKSGLHQALKRVWLMPGFYAMIAGILVKVAGIRIPDPIFDPLKLIGDSLVPFLLLVLGMQLAEVTFRGHWTAAWAATAIRLVLAAVVSYGLAAVLGLKGLTRQTMILENSMPSAILGVALAQEFDCEPGLITKVIFLSTLVGLITMTVLITLV